MVLAFSASLCQIPPVLTHQTKMVVLPPRITDENRDTERLSILPQLTQLLRAGLRTGPLWSNLEPRCCDDPEGAAETRWPMLSQAHTCTHTHTHTHTHTPVQGLHLWGYRSQRNQRATRRGQRGAEVYKEERPHCPGGQGIPFLVSLTQLTFLSPQELTVQ